MPTIKWLGLPPDLRRHLFDRAKERRISMEEILALEEWRRHSPTVPDGLYYQMWGRQSCLQPAFEPAPPGTCNPDEPAGKPAAAKIGCPTLRKRLLKGQTAYSAEVE